MAFIIEMIMKDWINILKLNNLSKKITPYPEIINPFMKRSHQFLYNLLLFESIINLKINNLLNITNQNRMF